MDKFPERYKLTRSHKKQLTWKVIFLFFKDDKMTINFFLGLYDFRFSVYWTQYQEHTFNLCLYSQCLFSNQPLSVALRCIVPMRLHNPTYMFLWRGSFYMFHISCYRILSYAPYKLLQNIELSSLHYIVGPCCLPILYTVVCTLISNS